MSRPRAKTKLAPLPPLSKKPRANPPKRHKFVPEIGRKQRDSGAMIIDVKKAREGAKIAEETVSVVAADELDAMLTEDLKGRKMKLLSPEEKVFIIEAYAKGISMKRIGAKLGRNHGVISRFLDKYRTTVPMARLHFEANAERLASRVTKRANVVEALEVLDRIDVLPKKQREDSNSKMQFNVIVGMPGQQQAVIVPPSQKQVEAAAEGGK